ncbi:MAG TPA: hypothetical protein VM616_05265 [Gammaproteobacteria bacterium]|nr:hypothetical protein [Gammaproteobacteria bacterium]
MTNTSIRFIHYSVLIAALAGVGLAQQALAQAEEDFGPTPQEAPPPATAPAAQPQSAPAVLASTDGENPGVRVEVTELKRTADDVVTLKFILINDSAEAFDFNYDLGDPKMGASDYGNIGGTHLIDNAGKKKYQVIRDAERKCVCSSGLKKVEPQSRMTLWARFPAPPAEVDKLSIMIPHFIPMDGVPLSQ